MTNLVCGNKGFTLTEILLAITIMVISGIILSGTIVSVYKIWPEEIGNLNARQKGALVLEKMVSSIRMARYEKKYIKIYDGQKIKVNSYYQGEEASLLYRVYKSSGVSALGVEVDGGNIRPLLNNVEELQVENSEGLINLYIRVQDYRGEEYIYTALISPRMKGR